MLALHCFKLVRILVDSLAILRLSHYFEKALRHHHELEDELFYVVEGTLRMEMHERSVVINEGEFFIVPRGVEHRPVAPEEVHIMLFEPSSTLNTGNVRNELTRNKLSVI